MNEHDEIELIDYINVIWKRKWLIIIPTLILAFLVGVLSLFLPRIWEVDAIIQPSKLFSQDAQGKYEEIVVVDPKQVAGQINQESYNNIIAAELNIDIELKQNWKEGR